MYEYNDEGKRRRDGGEKGHKGVIVGPCDGNRTSKICFLVTHKIKRKRGSMD